MDNVSVLMYVKLQVRWDFCYVYKKTLSHCVVIFIDKLVLNYIASMTVWKVFRV